LCRGSDPTFKGFEIQIGCPVEGDTRVGTVVLVVADYALGSEVETESFVAGELRVVTNVVGEGNELRSCCGSPHKGEPTDFEKGSSGIALVELRAVEVKDMSWLSTQGGADKLFLKRT
jgi:hypothetical protein